MTQTQLANWNSVKQEIWEDKALLEKVSSISPYPDHWTLEYVKTEELPDWDSFVIFACNNCKSEWYCPSYCYLLEKATKIDFSLIQQAYFRNGGDPVAVFRYIRRKYKTELEKGRITPIEE